MELKDVEALRDEVRKIIEVDEEKCDGCGLCIPNCAEGALQIVDGKARLVSDVYCDGLGACLGYCPKGVLKITEREAAPFDENEVHKYLESLVHGPIPCPSITSLNLETNATKTSRRDSALMHWPVQLRLVPSEAPRFEDADLLVVADCVPVAHYDFHGVLLPDRTVVMSCPKLDDIKLTSEKLKNILTKNDLRKITVAVMEVPCCSGLSKVVSWAVEASGKGIPVRKHVVGVRGEMR